MNRLKTTINTTIWTICGLYLCIVVLLNIPAVQSFVGTQIADIIANKLNTKVSVGRVDLGLLNRFIIDDLKINDQANKPLLKATRLSVKISFTELAKGNISINSAQIFGLDANIYRPTANADTNLQFVIDSLASKDTTKAKKPINLDIASLVIRHGKIRYNQLDSPDYRLTSLKHVSLSDISAHIILNRLTNDSINLNIKKLAFKEKAGLQLVDFKLRAIANRHKADITTLSIALPNSTLSLQNLHATYDATGDKLVLPSLQYEGELAKSNIYLPDLASIVEKLNSIDKTVELSAAISGTGTSAKLKYLTLSTDNKATLLSMNGFMSNGLDNPKWIANIDRLTIAHHTLSDVYKALNDGKSVPAILDNLGDIAFSGTLGGKKNEISANGDISTEAGTMQIVGGKENKHLSLNVSTNDFNLAKMLDNDHFGTLSTDIKLTASMGKKIDHATAVGKIDKLTYNGYLYHDINIDALLDAAAINGKIAINDDNIRLAANGTFSTDLHRANITANIADFRPKALNISSKWNDANFAANIVANYSGSDVDNINGEVVVNNLCMTSSTDNYTIDHISLLSQNRDNRHTITLNSDFANVALTGQFRIADLVQHAENLIAEKLPSIQQLTPIKTRKTADSRMLFYADITSAEPLKHFLGLQLDIVKPIRIDGYLNSLLSKLNIQATAPQIAYNGQEYSDISLDVASPEDAFKTTIKAKKLLGSGKRAEYQIDATAADNRVAASLKFDNHSKLHLQGNMNANAQFYKNKNGEMQAVVNVMPSEMLVDNTNWDIKNSTITYTPKHVSIDNFAIEHGDQHIHINGLATASNTDSVSIDLKDVDVAYILNLVNFHSVEFGGKASGKASVAGIFATPKANANLQVKEFTFEEGRMGTLYANVAWNNDEGQIDIDATAKDEDGRHTDIQGYVSPKRNYIDLGIAAHNTRTEFMLSFCSSFIDKCNAKANGKVRLWGPLNAIELTGSLDVNGNIHVSSLNTDYALSNAHVELKEGEIVLSNDTIIDRKGNIGIVNGSLYHTHLSRLTYNIDIDANNLLSYNFDGSDGSTFYGTAYATGHCNIRGRSGEVVMDIDVTPNAGSIVTYNTSSPDAIQTQEFIRWADRDTLNLIGTDISKKLKIDQLADIPSDIRLNFLVHTQPTATLRLIMDQASGDYIDLRGSGVIRATYYNKGAFELYGNYLVESGTYKLTIQNALHKDFEFLPGGTIAFGGNPYDAVLNLKAMYPVNSVSLSDLQLGKSFTSNNIRINCLMNITGTPNQPKVDFGLDMPTVSSDAKQMIYSLINSEEEMNQQVIYLLAVGRFYSQGNNNANADGTAAQSQTSLAMQSILSGQISQQINSLLGSVINNNNWNFGANISTGDEGWNNAEYEGILSGRLLNNRLLFNGQFGYRDNANATTSFIGDFDLRYLLYPNGNLAVRVYNQSNDRYFTRNSLTTQGLGFILKKDFNLKKNKQPINK